MPAGSTTHSQTGDFATDAVRLSPDASRRRRLVVVLIAGGWCAVLAGLVLATANPVTLNRRQILDADAVVSVQVGDPATGSCRIIRQWTGASLPAEIVVDHLQETAVKPGGDWILPLVSTPSGWEVLPCRPPSDARLVYPATPTALTQLETILASQTTR